MAESVKNVKKMSKYGHKVLNFGKCKENIIMCSQVKFDPDEPHSL